MGQAVTTPAQAEALCEAVHGNQLEAVSEMVCSGVSPNYVHDDTPVLWLAIQCGHLELASYLISAGADVNKVNVKERLSPLHCAATGGALSICAELIKAGAILDAADVTNQTPLSKAILAGHVQVAELLLRAGSNPNATLQDNDSEQMPGVFLPLHEAISGLKEEIATLLCQHGACVNTKDVHGRTPLHLAARLGSGRLTQLLLEHDALVEVTQENVTPLHLASREGHLEVARLLVKNGCNVNVQRKGWGCELYTPLHEATLNDRGAVVKLLCWAQANVNAQDYYSKTSLHIACERGYLGIVKTLIAYGCDTNIKEIGGYTPLFRAVKQKRLSITKALLKAMCNVDVTDGSGRTPLHLAAEKGMHETVAEILEHGARVKCCDKFKCTPLHYSICSGSIRCVYAILKHGHDLPPNECQVTELLQIVMTTTRYELFKMLVAMGWRPCTRGFTTLAQFIRETTAMDALLAWVEAEACSPPTLLNQCRNVIRRSLLLHTGNVSIYRTVDKLNLPSDMIEFLQLKDLHEKFKLNE